MHITQNLFGLERPTFVITATDNGDGERGWISLKVRNDGPPWDAHETTLFVDENPGQVLRRLAEACQAAADDLEVGRCHIVAANGKAISTPPETA